MNKPRWMLFSVGLIYKSTFSSFLGYSYDDDCIYVNGTGDTSYTMLIQLNKCGTLGSSDHGKKKRNSQATVSE